MAFAPIPMPRSARPGGYQEANSAQNPFAQFFGSRDGANALIGLGTGLLQGRNFSQGLAAGGQGFMEGAQIDDAYETQQREEAERQEALNQSIEYMRSRGWDDLVAAAQAGNMDAAWSEALARSRPAAPADPFTLGEGQVRYGPDGSIIARGPEPQLDPMDALAVEKEGFDRESALWKEYMAAEPVKTYQALRNSYERIRQSAETDSGPGDLGLIFNYMKMLDPGSVVREGEFATAENAGGVGQQVTNLYNRVVSGERLTPELRMQFLAAAERLYSEASSNLGTINEQMSSRAQGWGVDSSRILTQPETYPELQPGGWIDAGGGFRVRQK